MNVWTGAVSLLGAVAWLAAARLLRRAIEHNKHAQARLDEAIARNFRSIEHEERAVAESLAAKQRLEHVQALVQEHLLSE